MLTINHQGSFHYAKAFGDDPADVGDTDAVHWIASCTKFLTTVTVIQLEHKLDSFRVEQLPGENTVVDLEYLVNCCVETTTTLVLYNWV